MIPRHRTRAGSAAGTHCHRPGTDDSRGFTTMGKLFKIVLPIAVIAGLASVLLKKRTQA